MSSLISSVPPIYGVAAAVALAVILDRIFAAVNRHYEIREGFRYGRRYAGRWRHDDTGDR